LIVRINLQEEGRLRNTWLIVGINVQWETYGVLIF
jgi:hypothetical protein